jgi:hypothetical protein
MAKVDPHVKRAPRRSQIATKVVIDRTGVTQL